MCRLSTLICKYITLYNLLLFLTSSLLAVLLGAMIVHQCHDRVGAAIYTYIFNCLSYTDFEIFVFYHKIFAC
jgi:hypothetical protein